MGGGGWGEYLDMVPCAFTTEGAFTGKCELRFGFVLDLGRDGAEAVEGYQQHEGEIPRVHGVHSGCEHGGDDAAEGQGFAGESAHDEERRGHAGEDEVHCVGVLYGGEGGRRGSSGRGGKEGGDDDDGGSVRLRNDVRDDP